MSSLPALVSKLPNDLRRFLERVRERLDATDTTVTKTVIVQQVETTTATGVAAHDTTPDVIQDTPYTELVPEDAMLPHAPTGVSTSAGIASIRVLWDAPTYFGHSHTEVWRATTNDINAADLVGRAYGPFYTDPVVSGSTHYYWVRFISSDTYSTAGPFSSTSGVAGVTSAVAASWENLTEVPGNLAELTGTEGIQNSLVQQLSLVARGQVTVNGNQISKNLDGTNYWDAGVYSRDSFTGGAYCSLVPAQTSLNFMFGLNSDPLTDDSYTSLDYAFFVCNSAVLEVYESGVSKGVIAGGYAVGDVLAITYDGSSVTYLRNGVPVRVVTGMAPDLRLFFDSSWDNVGAKATNVQFGPMTSVVIGGTNLYQGSETFAGYYVYNATMTTPTVTRPDGTSGIAYRVTASTTNDYNLRLEHVIQSNGTYTFSVWAKAATGTVSFYLNVCDGPNSQTFTVGTTWTRISFTATVSNYSDSTYNFIDFVIATTGVGLDLWHPKMEVGNRATSWSPAPEDVASGISTAATTATWSGVSGTGKPADNATVGAQLGVNAKDEGGSTIKDYHALNRYAQNRAFSLATGSSLAAAGNSIIKTGASNTYDSVAIYHHLIKGSAVRIDFTAPALCDARVGFGCYDVSPSFDPAVIDHYVGIELFSDGTLRLWSAGSYTTGTYAAGGSFGIRLQNGECEFYQYPSSSTVATDAAIGIVTGLYWTTALFMVKTPGATIENIVVDTHDVEWAEVQGKDAVVEEGSTSFTPYLKFGGGSTGITYSTQSGWYVRHKSLVKFWLHIVLTSKGSSSGAATIFLGELLDPFPNCDYNTPVNLRLHNASGTTGYVPGATISGRTVSLEALQQSSGTTIAWTNGGFLNTTELIVSGEYHTNS